MTDPRSRGVIERAKEMKDKMAATMDGHPRSAEADEEITLAVGRLLETKDGETLFNWLRQITTNKILGANATATELAYQEGMRAVTALIDSRRVAAESRRINAKAGK